MTSRGIGIEDSGATGVDGFQTELGLVGGRQALPGPRQNDQALTIGQVEKPVDHIEIALR